MISGLRGTVSRYGASCVYMEVQGVEYEIHVPLNVFDSLSRKSSDEEVFLYIHHHFMQDEQRLFGFISKHQRDFFQAIQKVKGLGSSLSLSILSHLSPEDLLSLCERKDAKALSRIPRVGIRTAEILIFEVNRNLSRWKALLVESGERSAQSAKLQDEDLIMQALLQLGYKENQIRTSVLAAAEEAEKSGESTDSWNLSDWIHKCLKHL